MRSSLKTVLPLLLGVSPLLIAASSAPTTAQQMCGLDPVEADARTEVELTAANSQGAGQTAANERRPIAHPIVTSLQALVTSEQEWSSFLDRAVNAATGYWREHPNYSLRFATEAADAVAEQSRCMALNTESSDEISVGIADLKSFTKEDPKGDAIVPPGDVVDDLPMVEPADGGAQPAESVEPISADTSEPSVEPAAEPAEPVEAAPAPEVVPQAPAQPEAPAETPSAGSTLVPAPPAVEAIAAPDADPNNYTPDAQSPTPFDGTVPDSLQALPDGSYRYIEGRYENRAYSDEVLSANDVSVFLLTKTGNEVVGRLMPRLGEPGVCVDGTLNGNTIVGSAYPEVPVEELSKAESDASDEYVALGDTGLQVRGGVTLGEQTLYSDALLDLDNFSRINAGSAIAPTACLSIPTAPAELQAPVDGSIEAAEPAESSASLPSQ